jgi:hypothetical protein
MVRPFAAHRAAQSTEEAMSTKALIQMPGQAKAVTLSGEPLAFLVTGEHTKHTSMF